MPFKKLVFSLPSCLLLDAVDPKYLGEFTWHQLSRLIFSYIHTQKVSHWQALKGRRRRYSGYWFPSASPPHWAGPLAPYALWCQLAGQAIVPALFRQCGFWASMISCPSVPPTLMSFISRSSVCSFSSFNSLKITFLCFLHWTVWVGKCSWLNSICSLSST